MIVALTDVMIVPNSILIRNERRNAYSVGAADMCYFLYGGINSGINIGDYKKISRKRAFFFNEGTVSDVKRCIENCEDNYRITSNYCDCETALGSHETNAKELLDLSEHIAQLRKVRGIKHIFISKNWWKHKSEREETVHIDDIDVVQYLADIQDDCLYKIQLFRKP